MKRLVFIGDVHLEPDDEHLPAFLRTLDRLAETGCRRLVLMGDLFNLWLGQRELEQSHHRAVLARLAGLRSRGVVVRYLEGNRDYRIGSCHVGRALDEAGETGFSETFGGHRLFAVHGDLANEHDRQYRLWRRFSRSGPVWGLFGLLPRGTRQSVADSLERRMRSSNMEFKGGFPEQAVRSYAQRFFDAGHDVVVLGHFHIEKELSSGPPGEGRRIFVLPEWKGSRRHLEVLDSGEVRFADSP